MQIKVSQIVQKEPADTAREHGIKQVSRDELDEKRDENKS
jgi:hypothetical protein